MNLYEEANRYFEEALKEENAKLNESLKKKKLKESATARKQLRESTGKAFNLATLQEGDLLYNEQEQIIAPVSKKPGSEPAALVQKVDKESLVSVKQLSTGDWKVVTKNDFPKGSLLWYLCLNDDEREHAKVDDTDDYERAFADALDLLQSRHPDADLVYDSAVQGGWGEIYLRDENTDSEISWDVDEEEEEFYDYLVGVYSYDVLVDGLATWLDSKYEEMIETADEDSDFDESFKYNKSGESKLRETTIEDPYYLAIKRVMRGDTEAADIVYGWYKAEEAFSDFNNAKEFEDFVRDDIYAMLDAAGDRNEVKIVHKALGDEDWDEESEEDRDNDFFKRPFESYEVLSSLTYDEDGESNPHSPFLSYHDITSKEEAIRKAKSKLGEHSKDPISGEAETVTRVVVRQYKREVYGGPVEKATVYEVTLREGGSVSEKRMNESFNKKKRSMRENFRSSIHNYEN